jgi:ubiquitin carboxyl-terminal hydrolase 34
LLQVAAHVLTEQTCNLIENLISSLSDIMSQVNVQATAYKLNGDLRALALVYNSDVPLSPSEELISTVDALLMKTKLARKQAAEVDVTGESLLSSESWS